MRGFPVSDQSEVLVALDRLLIEYTTVPGKEEGNHVQLRGVGNHAGIIVNLFNKKSGDLTCHLSGAGSIDQIQRRLREEIDKPQSRPRSRSRSRSPRRSAPPAPDAETGAQRVEQRHVGARAIEGYKLDDWVAAFRDSFA